MRKALVLFIVFAGLLIPSGAPAQTPVSGLIREVLPADGLIGSSVVRIRDQAALNAHYYLADETVLGFDKKTEAIFARYRLGTGEALVLAVAYAAKDAVDRVYGRFGRDFFSDAFDPKSLRFLEKLESGDYAGIARAGSVLVVVLESPGRKSCDDLLRRIEENARALF
jgi:hypothetical protein